MSKLEFCRPKWPAPSNIAALTTRREGGVSQEPYASLNLGAHVGDDPQSVTRNRAILVKQAGLPWEPNWLQQVHGLDIIDLDIYSIGENIQADGSYSRTANKVCAIMTADCLPLFLTNSDGSEVMLLHVGWRGLADGIIERGVSMMQSAPSNLIIWAGPCIGAECFEIGSEVKQLLDGPDAAFRASTKGKWFADLVMVAQARLENCGVNEFSQSTECTYQDQGYFSYRRDGVTGRMASLLWMQK